MIAASADSEGEEEVIEMAARGVRARRYSHEELLVEDHPLYLSDNHHPHLEDSKRHMSVYVTLLTVAAAIGGFLFGYDTGVVSGAMLKIVDEMALTSVQEEVVVSSTIAAAIAGSVFGGKANQRFGRRPSILFAAGTFTLGAIVMGEASSFQVLVLGRITVGLGIGVASLTTPVYIAEAAPSHMRGSLVTLNTLLITLGQFSAGMVDGIFAAVPGGWRYMLGLSGVPSFVMLISFLFLPESPRWLAKQGRFDEARAVLKKLRNCEDVSEEEEEIRISTGQSLEGSAHASFTDLLLDPPVRRALCLGCGLMALQQLSGINTVMYYAATIYEMAGFSENASIWLSGFTALAQAVGVSIGLFLVERRGRRQLILTSLGLVFVSLVTLGAGFFVSYQHSEPVYDLDQSCASYHNMFLGQVAVDRCSRCVQLDSCGFCSESNACYSVNEDLEDLFGRCQEGLSQTCSDGYGYLAIISMVCYLCSFGIGMSSVPWTVNAEIYPLRARALATSVSTSVNWIGNVVISSTFLSLANPSVLTRYGAFWAYAFLSGVGWLWLWFSMPETSSLSLEEIEELFKDGAELRRQPSEGGLGFTKLHEEVEQ